MLNCMPHALFHRSMNRICDTWNTLPDTYLVEASYVNTFKSQLDSIDLRKHCIF